MKNSINHELKKPITTDFSAGLYDWSIFLTNFYLRVKQVLKIDYESFMILQITLGYYLNTINKSGSNSIDDLSFRFEEIINEKTKKNSRLSVTSISSALNLPRETVKRKIDSLIKKQLLAMNNNKSIILIDDVLNSGRTLIYATRYILDSDIKYLTTVVLVDRKHRKFPIKANFVGLTLSTTLQEHISVDFKEDGIKVFLD